MMLRLIVKREFTTLLGSKAMRLSTGLLVGLLLIAGAVGGFFIEKNGVDTTPPPATGHTMQTNPAGYLIGTIFLLVSVIPIFTGMGSLNAGVVEEKSSRVVEIILTTVKPRTLLLGKILGIGAAMLVVFACYLAGIIGGLVLAGLMPSLQTLSSLGLWKLLPMAVVWLIIGYLSFAALSGALASTVSRQEDLGAVQTPIIFMAIVPMYVAMYLVPYLPDSPVTRILSHIPLFSPFMMPMRASLGGAAVWEQLLALAMAIALIPLLASLAGKIYERSILHTGERLKVSQVLRRG